MSWIPSELIEPLQVRRVRVRVRVVLVALPPGADAEHQTTVADVVERRGQLGEHRRRTKGHGRDRGHQTDPLGDGRDRGQRREALELRSFGGPER